MLVVLVTRCEQAVASDSLAGSNLQFRFFLVQSPFSAIPVT